MSLNRKHFLGMGAAAASAGVASGLLHGTTPADAAFLKPGTFDQSFLSNKADVRQIWDFTTIDQVQTGLGAARNALNAFKFTYMKSAYAILDLRGPTAIVYALDDAMWQTYSLGTKNQIVDAKTGEFAVRNLLYPRTSTDKGSLPPDSAQSFYQDGSIQALIQRGIVHVAACHDALTTQASQAVADGRNHGRSKAQVLADMIAHLVPGATQTPSGSSLIAIAQQMGFTYAKQ